MADTDLRALHQQLQSALGARIRSFTEESSTDDYVPVLSYVRALRVLNERIRALEDAGVDDDVGLQAHRTQVLHAMRTLAEEIGR